MKNLKLTLLAFTLLLVFNLSYSQTIDSEKSHIKFRIKAMTFSSVEGSVKGMTGTIAFTEDTLEESSFNVCLQPETIDTDNEKRDTHLKNEDFFSVTEYTTVCFQSSSITKSKSSYLTKGELTLHGAT